MKSVYLTTVFDCPSSFPTPFPSEWVIVTAYNPFGQKAPQARNQHQDATLKSILQQKGYPHWRVTGQSPNGQHQEPGWGCIVDIQEAKAMAKLFKQDAIYLIKDDQLFLYSCHNDEQVEMGSFSERLVHAK